MKSLYQSTLLALAITALTACGGGSSESSKDTDRDNNDSQALQLLQSGVYEMKMFEEFVSGFPSSSLANLYRNRLSVTNGTFQVNTDYLTPSGWITEADYFDDISNTPSYAVSLTASGWQDRESRPCSLNVTSEGLMMDCVGRQTRVTLEPGADLATTSLANTFVQIASTELRYSDNAYQAVIAGTEALTQAVGANAKTYRFNSVSQMPEVYSPACDPTAPNQPVAEWSCRTQFTSTSWDELALNDEVFSVVNVNAQSIQVQLDGDLGNANSGNIVLVNDFTGELAPGTVIDTWQKINVHGQTIIRLFLSNTNYGDQAGEVYDALAIVNGQIVQAWYKPTGNQYSMQVFNAEAATALSNAAVGIFPITVSE